MADDLTPEQVLESQNFRAANLNLVERLGFPSGDAGTPGRKRRRRKEQTPSAEEILRGHAPGPR